MKTSGLLNLIQTKERNGDMKRDTSHIDKWDMLLDMLENPSAYSEAQKNEILGDEETLEMYRQIVNVRQTLDSQKKNEEISLPSVDEEWEKLKEKKLENAGIEPKAKRNMKTVALWSPMRKVAAIVTVLVVSGFTFAAIHLAYKSFQTSPTHETKMAKEKIENKDSMRLVATEAQKTDVVNDSVSAKLPLIYEDMELQAILKPIAQHFNVQVVYRNESARHIRLYLQLTERMSLDEIVELMNHFGKVNIHSEGNTLIVE